MGRAASGAPWCTWTAGPSQSCTRMLSSTKKWCEFRNVHLSPADRDEQCCDTVTVVATPAPRAFARCYTLISSTTAHAQSHLCLPLGTSCPHTDTRHHVVTRVHIRPRCRELLLYADAGNRDTCSSRYCRRVGTSLGLLERTSAPVLRCSAAAASLARLRAR